MRRLESYSGMRRSLNILAVVLVMSMGALAVAFAATYDEAGARENREATAFGKNGPETVYALTRSDNLLRFDGDTPEVISQRKPVTGLAGDDSLVGIDFRPANGRMYGVGENGNVYTINQETAVATRTATLKTTEGQRVSLRGERFGVDFNPTVDRLRIVSDADQNLRVDVESGDTTVDPDITYARASANPATTGVAYTNNRPSSFGGSTKLYYVETNLDLLATTNDANSGVIFSVGGLGVPAKMIVGFDVVTRGDSNAAYAALKPGVTSSFYAVRLNSGRAVEIGQIDGRGTDVEGIAIPIGQR